MGSNNPITWLDKLEEQREFQKDDLWYTKLDGCTDTAQ